MCEAGSQRLHQLIVHQRKSMLVYSVLCIERLWSNGWWKTIVSWTLSCGWSSTWLIAITCPCSGVLSSPSSGRSLLVCVTFALRGQPVSKLLHLKNMQQQICMHERWCCSRPLCFCYCCYVYINRPWAWHFVVDINFNNYIQVYIIMSCQSDGSNLDMFSHYVNLYIGKDIVSTGMRQLIVCHQHRGQFPKLILW